MKSMHDVAQYDLVPPNAKVPENVCYAQSFAVVKYVNARRASHSAAVNVHTLLEKFVFKTLAFWLQFLEWRTSPWHKVQMFAHLVFLQMKRVLTGFYCYFFWHWSF